MTSSIKNHNLDAWRVTFCFLLAAVTIMLPELAAATGTNEYLSTKTEAEEGGSTINTIVCNMVRLAQGPAARGVAAFAIIFLGFSMFLGKISWGNAIALGTGLGAIFGAGKIAGLMAGTANACTEAAAAG